MDRDRHAAPAARAARSVPRSSVVCKFGGSSLATPERVRRVAARVAAAHAEHRRVVVVVSAMGKTTDELVSLAGAVSRTPAPRELDVLLTAGERISIALLAMALEARGVPAVSLTGRQSGIVTEGPHTRARIVDVRPERVERALDEGRVAVVAGFQGVDREGEVTTLGRGGSDTTAVALAAALGAPTCDIFSDVDGVYSADPRLCPRARHLGAIDYDTMQELSRQGARVLHAIAVEHARRGGVTIRAGATSGSTARTLIGAASARRDDVLALARSASREVALAVTGRRDLIRLRALDREVAGALRATLGERVPLLAASERAGAAELWAIGEELPDARAFARSLEERWPDRVSATTGFGSVAVVGAPGIEALCGELDRTLARAGVAVHGRALTPHACTAIVELARVDDAIRAVHASTIERGEERVSCAS